MPFGASSARKRLFLRKHHGSSRTEIAANFRIEVSAQKADQNVTIVNKTGIEIFALFVTPHSSNDWGDDVLDVDTLPANEEVGVLFTRKEKAQLWDLRIEDKDGNSIEWDKISLNKTKKITLYYKNKKPTAIIE